MPKSFFFSINLLIKSDSHLEKAVASVVAEESFFLNHVQLILIDTLGSELSLKVCAEYSRKYPENVYFVDAYDKGNVACFNDAAPLCTGKYIAYIDNYGEYSKKTLSSLMKTIGSGRIPILCIQPVVSTAGEESRPYVTDISNGIVKLKETPEKFILMLGCYFFHRRITHKLMFDEQLRFHGDIKFITEALLLTDSYVFTNTHVYTSAAPSEHDAFHYVPQYSRTFYTPMIDQLIIPMLISSPGSVLAQCIMLYLIEMRFFLNEDERYKYVIIGSYTDAFFDKVSKALNYIDNAIILNKTLCRRCHLDEEMPFRLLRLKYKQPELMPEIDLALPKKPEEKSYYDLGGRLEKKTLEGEFIAHYQKNQIGSSREITAEITAVNYDSEGLYIDGTLYGCSYLREEDYQLFVTINGERHRTVPSSVYTLRKYFDKPFLKRSSFRFFVPVSHGKAIDTFFLSLKYGKLLFRIGMTFHSLFARLSTEVKNSFWNFLDRLMTYDPKTKSVVIRRATSSLLSSYESKFLIEAGRRSPLTEEIYYRQLRKNVRSALSEKGDHQIILFYDDNGINYNGNLLFRYFSKFKGNDKIEVYFAARRNSDEHEFLVESEYDNILEIGSKKAKTLALCADLIFAADCDVYESLGFTEKDRLYLKDLINARIISIKNFFMTYATAQFDNRLRDNTQLFFCSSEKEKEHLLKSIYDYDEAMIRVTGYPILDTLTDNRKKIILLAPGERRQFCIYDNSEFYHFSESRFFKLYQALITDARLVEALKQNGYELAVLMPRSIEKFRKLFSTNDVVKLYENNETNEFRLVSESALLITDYCDILYRFAYLNKPVIYYFPHALPIQQEYKNEGLAKSSFGELFFEQDSIVAYLLEEIKKDFPQKEHYAKKCHDFFRYHDSDNCKRIVKSIISTFFSSLYP